MHTPGPWTIDGQSRQGEVRIVAPYKPSCTYQVALVSPDVPNDAARDANARLIAAAPDLLAACKAAIEWHNRPPATEVERRNTMDILNRAIWTAEEKPA